jgi:hypothetical protein
MSIYDKASLVHIPSGYRSGTLYNVLPNNADGDFDFSRGSTGTRVNKDGLIETVASNTPRLDYPLLDGVVQDCPTLLLEPSRTNSIIYSEDFANSDWTKTASTITSNSIISPDGTLNASKLTEDTSNSTHRISDAIIVSGTGITYTQSIFAKSGGNGRYLRMFRGSGTYNNAVFDLENGTVVTASGNNLISVSIEKYPNGWYRCISTYTTQFSNIATYYGLQNGDTDSYQGDGTSHIYLWGAQLEEGSYATSYIPSLTGSQTTRSADVCNGAEADFNDSEGVLYANIAALADDNTSRRISISDGSSNPNNLVCVDMSEYTNQIIGRVRTGNTEVAFLVATSQTQTQNNKIAVKYKVNNFALWINGFEVDTDNNGAAPIGLNDVSFDRGNGSNDFYGKTKEVMTFNEALSDSELEALTSYDSFNEMATEQLYTIE